jgi:hypothetical protein
MSGVMKASSGRSPVVVVLTTSDGRDKIFKALQSLLKAIAWILLQPGFLPGDGTAFRATLVQRLIGNIHTVRNGRALFKLGSWVATIFDFVDLRSRLSWQSSNRTAVVLMIVRCFLSLIRNVLRDCVHLFEKNLFGLHLNETVKAPLSAAYRYVASICWVSIAAIELGLLMRRLTQSEWLPEGSCLRCSCDDVSRERLEFEAADFDQGCPSVRNADFSTAVAPRDFLVRCVNCRMTATVGEKSEWMQLDEATSARLLLPKALRGVLGAWAVMAAHPNLRETVLLTFTAACDLCQALCCASMSSTECLDLGQNRNLLSNVCGLTSSILAVRRLWLAAA